MTTLTLGASAAADDISITAAPTRRRSLVSRLSRCRSPPCQHRALWLQKRLRVRALCAHEFGQQPQERPAQHHARVPSTGAQRLAQAVAHLARVAGRGVVLGQAEVLTGDAAANEGIVAELQLLVEALVDLDSCRPSADGVSAGPQASRVHAVRPP